MDCRTGQISYFDNEENMEKFQKAMQAEQGRQMVPISNDLARELEPLPPRVRKNKMRNKPCVCGSGKKFKKCCWSKYA